MSAIVFGVIDVMPGSRPALHSVLRLLLPQHVRLGALPLILLAGAMGLFIGFDLPWPGWLGGLLLLLALGGPLIFHLRHLARLAAWSRAPFADPNLSGGGDWDGVFRRLYRHEKEMAQQIKARDREITLLIAASQALTDGVVLLDAQNQIVFCNRIAEEQLGLCLAADRGLPVVNLVRLPEFIQYLAAGEFATPLELRLDRGQERVLVVHVMPYVGARRLMQVRDVTLADRMDRMRRDFVANVSHELRTPLTVLRGFIETLQDIQFTPEERAGYLGLMAEQAERMSHIVQDLLTLSAIESAPPPVAEVIDMRQMLDSLERDAQALSGGRHAIEIECSGQGNLYGAENELISAFANLVANAVRYTPAGGRVVLEWRVDAAGAEFAVRDTGPGIAPEHLSRLTERFYRIDRSRSREAGGTGLGLAIVKHALQRHQARLAITSEPGRGSCFAAVFPRARIATQTISQP